MTLRILQGQNIEFEAINFSSMAHGLFVCPKPSYKPLHMELFTYKKDMVSISRFLIPLPPKLGSTIPISLHDPSRIPIARQRPSTKVMWIPNGPIG